MCDIHNSARYKKNNEVWGKTYFILSVIINHIHYKNDLNPYK